MHKISVSADSITYWTYCKLASLGLLHDDTISQSYHTFQHLIAYPSPSYLPTAARLASEAGHVSEHGLPGKPQADQSQRPRGYCARRARHSQLRDSMAGSDFESTMLDELLRVQACKSGHSISPCANCQPLFRDWVIYVSRAWLNLGRYARRFLTTAQIRSRWACTFHIMETCQQLICGDLMGFSRRIDPFWQGEPTTVHLGSTTRLRKPKTESTLNHYVEVPWPTAEKSKPKPGKH